MKFPSFLDSSNCKEDAEADLVGAIDEIKTKQSTNKYNPNSKRKILPQETLQNKLEKATISTTKIEKPSQKIENPNLILSLSEAKFVESEHLETVSSNDFYFEIDETNNSKNASETSMSDDGSIWKPKIFH
jgi:hypothetical protein